MLRYLERLNSGEAILILIGIGVIYGLIFTVVNTTRYPKNRSWLSAFIALAIVALGPALYWACNPADPKCDEASRFSPDMPGWMWWATGWPVLYLIALAEFWIITFCVLLALNFFLAPWLKSKQLT